MSPGKPVAIEVLVDRLWGERPPAKARDDLRVYISRLGRALRQVPDEDAHIVTQAHGYALVTDPQEIDLHQFHLLQRQADAMALSSDDEQAATLLRQAEALWRGQALAGLPGDWAARMRTSLGEERRAAIARRIELELRLGHHTGLAGELSRLTDEYPLDEALIGHQMTALYRCGRQADALRVYWDARAQLVGQGIEPGPALAGLQQAILRHDPQLTLAPVFHPGQVRQPDTLPHGVVDFVGRADEIGHLVRQSENSYGPLIQVIEGMPGVGKTALAVQAAHRLAARYPDARLFLCFHAHDPVHQPLRSADALYRLLRMLDVPATRIPGDFRGRVDVWQAELVRRRVVIVFDDVRDAAEIRPLLPSAGDSLTLVTSRRRHDRQGGIPSLTLDTLPNAEAITLFTLVGGVRADDADQVARAVGLCGRLPLAIRVTASRLRHGNLTGVTELLEELSAWAGEPGFTMPVSPDIVPVFDASYQGLTSGQRRLFRYLGINPCPDASVYTAMALTGSKLPAAQAAIRALLDHHLLAEPEPGRYQFHDIIHAYAASRCVHEDPEPERRAAIASLLGYYLGTVRAASKTAGIGRDQNPASDDRAGRAVPVMDTADAARKWLGSEWRNVLLAARYAAEHEWQRECASLTDAMTGFLGMSGHWDEAIEAHTLALQVCRDLDDRPGAARSVCELSLANLRAGRHDVAMRHASDAAQLYRTLGDRRGEAAALDRIGIVHRLSARFRESLAHHQEAAEIYRGIDDVHGMALALCHAGSSYSGLGRYLEAIESLNRALTLCRQIGDKRGEAITLNNIGAVHHEQGYHRDATKNYQESFDIFAEIDGQQNIALLQHNMGRIHQYKGDYEKALATYRAVLASYRSMGDLRDQAYILCDIGSAYENKGSHEEALAHHEKACSLAQEIGDPYIHVKTLCGMAETQRGSGQHQQAFNLYRKALSFAREIEAPGLEARALQGMGDTVLPVRGTESARIYWRQALDIFRQMGTPEATTMEIRLDELGASA